MPSDAPEVLEGQVAAEPPVPKTLIKKLAAIVAEIDHVEKKGRNEFHKYDYVKAADLANAVRVKLSKQGVFLLSDVIDMRVERVGDFMFTTIDVLYTFHDGETGEKLCFKMPGVGADKSDKGLYKAITGSLKYALRNAFLVPDEKSDPEGDESVDRAEGKAAAKEVARQKIAAATLARVEKADEGLPPPFKESLPVGQGIITKVVKASTHAKQGKPSRPYWEVWQNGNRLSSFDNILLSESGDYEFRLWAIFEEKVVGEEADFIVESKPGPSGITYHNIVAVKRIADRRYDVAPTSGGRYTHSPYTDRTPYPEIFK